jgi:hypothetical protein
MMMSMDPRREINAKCGTLSPGNDTLGSIDWPHPLLDVCTVNAILVLVHTLVKGIDG